MKKINARKYENLLKIAINMYIFAKKPNNGGTPHKERIPIKKKNFKELIVEIVLIILVLIIFSLLINENNENIRVNANK